MIWFESVSALLLFTELKFQHTIAGFVHMSDNFLILMIKKTI